MISAHEAGSGAGQRTSRQPERGSRRPRLAVVGTGVAGLVAAHRLRERYDLVVLEADERIGGHVHTIGVDDPKAGPVGIDTGFIVFNRLNYPGFSRLLDELGVASHATTMSFSFRSDAANVEYNGTRIGTLFAQRRNLLRPRFHRMVRDILRFHREGRAVLHETDDALTVEAYLERERYSSEFAEWFLLPMGAALWSCPADRFRSFPMRLVAEFMDNHRMLQVSGRPEWRVVTGGSRTYVDALVAPFRDRIRTSTPVHGVRRHANRVDLRLRDGSVESFDQVVLACHADQALRMLDDADATESEILSAFPYTRNEVVLHTDTSVLPRRRRAWAAWNYQCRGPEDTVRVTYDMNMLQGIDASETYCVTLNDDGAIDPSRVIRRMTYHHPAYDERRAGAQARHDALIARRRTSFCGAYWGYGFHEDGVRSATRVSDALERLRVPA